MPLCQNHLKCGIYSKFLIKALYCVVTYIPTYISMLPLYGLIDKESAKWKNNIELNNNSSSIEKYTSDFLGDWSASFVTVILGALASYFIHKGYLKLDHYLSTKIASVPDILGSSVDTVIDMVEISE